MRRQIGYTKGYQIKIFNGFYEVSRGNKAVYYGKCRKNSTIQEIINKTLLSEEANTTFDRKGITNIIGTGGRYRGKVIMVRRIQTKY